MFIAEFMVYLFVNCCLAMTTEKRTDAIPCACASWSLSAKWKSRLVSCRWLTWSSRDARHGRPLIASRSSWGELFCRQPLIIHPGFPPTWLCLVEQQNHFHSFSDCSIFSWLLSSSPRDCFLSNVRVMLKQEKQDFRLMWIQQIAPLPALNLCPVVCLTDAL